MRKILLFLCILIILNSLYEVSAICESGNIDINTASLEELDGLSGIGPVKAQAIIDTRPFQSLDNLVDVSGIGEAILAKIKQQGLACVEGEETVEEEKVPQGENTEEESVKEKEITKEYKSINNKETSEVETSLIEKNQIIEEEIKPIVISSSSPKDIKTERDKEQLNKNKLAIYGIIVFCILLVFLFVLKNRKNEKNEFK